MKYAIVWFLSDFVPLTELAEITFFNKYVIMSYVDTHISKSYFEVTFTYVKGIVFVELVFEKFRNSFFDRAKSYQ